MPEFLESPTTWIILLLAGGCAWLAWRLWLVRRRLSSPMSGMSVAQGTLLMESLYAGLGDACLLVAEDGQILYQRPEFEVELLRFWPSPQGFAIEMSHGVQITGMS